jgi:hypothetical protein
MENQDKYKKWFYITVIFSFLVMIGSITGKRYYENLLEDSEWNNEVLADSIKQYKTKEGLNATRIKVFESSEAEYFMDLVSKDSTIIKLQKLVKENEKYISKQGSVAIINTQAHAEVTVPTKITNDPLIPEKEKYPIYESNFNLKGWVWGNSIATKDSTSYKLNYREELSVIIGREKTGFLGLGKGVPYADVTLYNPYSEVKDMRVYQTKLPKEKKFGIGPNASYGIGNEFKTQWYFGIGVNYNLFEF